MPVSRNAHHTQLLATPFSRTRLVTRFGVSVLKVVATIETPIEPPRRRAARGEELGRAASPARRASTTAGMNETTIDSTTMNQSSGWSSMVSPSARGRSEGKERRPVATRPAFKRATGFEPATLSLGS